MFAQESLNTQTPQRINRKHYRMTDAEKLELLVRTIEADPEDLSPETVLENLDYWDSLAKLSLLAMFSNKFDRELNVNIIRGFKTVQDILQEMHA